MRSLLMVLLLFGLAACGQMGESCDGSVSCQSPTPDHVTPKLEIPVATNGLTLPPLNFYGTGDDADIDGAFAAVSLCLDMQAPPNGVVIEYVPGLFDCGGVHTNGCFWPDSHTIQLADISAVRHEFIHYFLKVNTGDSDRNHTRPEWRCQYWS